ncbi:DUF6300 family protein [Micromonospora sp. NPDC048063]|uniref:DUF6300 family protein n=1 Tax=Micromonospora sp. NPDC048063 TaxID=3364256 RepID=UPI003723B9C1
MTHDWPCHRCGTDNVLAVLHLPHTWTNTSGNQVPVVSKYVLCARCDADDPLTGPIVTHFTVQRTAQPEDVAQLARDLLRWIGQARPAIPDENALKAEVDAWYRGEL